MKKFLQALFLSSFSVLFISCGNSGSGSTSVASVVQKQQLIPTSGYFPVEIVNSTNLGTNVPIYFLVKALTVGTNQQCVMTFNSNGYGTCNVLTSNNTLPAVEATTISSLPINANGNAYVYLPQAISGRIYFSVGQPMSLYYNPNSQLIGDPDSFNPLDTNYYNLYDKVEFSFNDAGTWANPTAVDDFSLPISISQSTSTTTGTNIDGVTTYPITQSGLTGPRTQIFSDIRAMFAANDTTNTHEWSKLLLDYTNSSNITTDLRIVAPVKAMTVGLTGTNPFNSEYLARYTKALWEYYKNHTVKVDCSEIGLGIFTGQVDENNNFTFTNGSGVTASIAEPTDSTSFFGGAGGTFNQANNTPGAIIVRELTGAFEAGLLPAPSGTLLNQKFFFMNYNNFYADQYSANSLLGISGGPWSDLYSRALHQYGKKTQPIYTFAYDDALGQDGTLHDPSGATPGILTITLHDLSGTTLPNPYVDDNKYNVTMILPGVSSVSYNGTAVQTNQTLQNVTSPLNVILNGQQARIYLNPTIIQPSSPLLAGVVVKKSATNNADYTISFPAPSDVPQAIVPLPSQIPVPVPNGIPAPTVSPKPAPSVSPAPSTAPTVAPSPTPTSTVPVGAYSLTVCNATGTDFSSDGVGSNIILSKAKPGCTTLNSATTMVTYYVNKNAILFNILNHSVSTSVQGVVVTGFTSTSMNVNLPANVPASNPTPSTAPTVAPSPTPTSTVPVGAYSLTVCTGLGTDLSSDAQNRNVVVANGACRTLNLAAAMVTYYTNGHAIEFNLSNHSVSTSVQGVVVIGYTTTSMNVDLPANVPLN